MKKFIFYTVIFLVAVVVIDFGFGMSCDYMTTRAKGGSTKYLTDLTQKDSYDILIMGSSKAHHNYIPQTFNDSLGLTCYNAGYDGNGIILAYGILSMMNDDCLPLLVIYDVKQQFDVYHYSGDGDYTRYYQLLKPFYKHPEVAGIIKSISRWDLIKFHSGLVRYNGVLYNTISNYLYDSDENFNYGYVPVKGMLVDDVAQERDYTLEIDTLKIAYFKHFIELTKKKNIRLLIVLSPEYNSNELYDFQPIFNLCSEEAIPIIDYYNNSNFQEKELFKDHCHLNENGARFFTETMVGEIQRMVKLSH